MKYILLFVLLFSLGLSSCSQSNDPNYDEDYKAIEKAGIKEAVSLANEWHYSKPDIVSFINSDEMVIVFPDGRKVTRSLPEDEMLVAIAPYINSTHECAVHYFSSCTGELKGRNFSVEVFDSDNNIVYDSITKSMKNGFLELWLPRGKEYEVMISHDGLSAQQDVSTYQGDNTCITTMRLE